MLLYMVTNVLHGDIFIYIYNSLIKSKLTDKYSDPLLSV